MDDSPRTIGRYQVQESLGEGALVAFDPELHRTVAVRLLPADPQLLGEARAMAQLSHPNVVAVYDVGEVDGQAFLAMERIDGDDLRGWRAARRRSWREIVAVFAAAGRGLAAAHAAGLVHRDVKPASLLVGRDGRARISDFGLASGTPANLAPEGALDACSDQYAFCVALAEALDGTSPPRRIAAAVERGRRAAPGARWPSMAPLLDALERDPTAHLPLIAGGVVLVALGAVAAWALLRGAPAAADPCEGGQSRLAGVWDDPRQQAIHDAFVASGLPYADDTWTRVHTRLDGFAAAWLDGRRDACRATRVAHTQLDAVMDLRMQCLDRRLDALRALGDQWLRGVDGDGLGRAIDAATAFASVAACADGAALAQRTPLPDDPATRAAIGAVEAHLDAVGALGAVGRWADAKTAAEAARREADATGWTEVQAEAALALGKALSRLEDPAAEPPLTDASRLGETAHDDRLAATALSELVDALGWNQQATDRALLAAQLADGAVTRAGDGDDLRGELALARADTYFEAARYDDADRDYAEARRLLGSALGADAADTLAAVSGQESVAQARGDYPRAEALSQELLAIATAKVGPVHPSIASDLHNLGFVYEAAGDLEKARDPYTRALAIKATLYGADSASYALTLNNLGDVEIGEGHLDAASSDYQRALAIREKLLGPDHPFVASTLGNLADVRKDQGRLDEALSLGQRALAIKIKAHGAEHPTVANSLYNLAEVLRKQGNPRGALDDAQRALAIRTKALGAGHADTLSAQVQIGEIAHELGDDATARAGFDAAIVGFTKVAPDHPDLAAALGDRARLELATDRAAAAADCRRAIAILGKTGAHPESVAGLQALLARAGG